MTMKADLDRKANAFCHHPGQVILDLAKCVRKMGAKNVVVSIREGMSEDGLPTSWLVVIDNSTGKEVQSFDSSFPWPPIGPCED